MSAAYLVLYEGRPKNELEFDRRYREEHVPILRRFPNIRSIRILKGTRETVLYMVVEMLFSSLPDLDAALASEARAAARRDREQWLNMSFDGSIRHQTVVIDELAS